MPGASQGAWLARSDRQNQVPFGVYLTVKENLKAKRIWAAGTAFFVFSLYFVFFIASRRTSLPHAVPAALAALLAAFAVFVIWCFTKGKNSVGVSYAFDTCCGAVFCLAACVPAAVLTAFSFGEGMGLPKKAYAAPLAYTALLTVSALYAAAAAAVYLRLGESHPQPADFKRPKTRVGLLFLLLPPPVFALGIFTAKTAFGLSGNAAAALGVAAVWLWVSLSAALWIGLKTAFYRAWSRKNGAAAENAKE